MERARYHLDTTFSTSLDIGKVVKYLNSGEISLRDATEIALASFYHPLAAAQEGASLEEVRALIEISRTQFETSMSLAISRSQKQLDLNSKKKNLNGEKLAIVSSRQLVSSYQDGEQLIGERENPEIEGIRFEDEEL